MGLKQTTRKLISLASLRYVCCQGDEAKKTYKTTPKVLPYDFAIK